MNFNQTIFQECSHRKVREHLGFFRVPQLQLLLVFGVDINAKQNVMVVIGRCHKAEDFHVMQV